MTHFCALADPIRWRVGRHFRLVDQPPPNAAFEMACRRSNLRLHPGRPWQAVRLDGDEIVIETPKGALRTDHLLLGTGAIVELEARAELKTLAPAVLRWRDRFTPETEECDERLAALPYLDDHYAFMARAPGDRWIERVFCFNAASVLSHGPHSTSISGHRHCVPRVVRGVTERLFREQQRGYLAKLASFDTIDLAIPDDFETTIEDPERILELS
jgi:FAD-dependent urate hydroxylase